MISKLICVLFGHRPRFGYAREEGRGYFRQRIVQKDGMGRVHIELFSDCQRCDKPFRVGMIHHLTKDELR